MGVNTRIVFTLFLIACAYFPTLAQWKDDFSDGNFTSRPAWIGNTADWVVAVGVLRSNDTLPNSSFFLCTPSNLVKATSWQISVHLAFNTSSLNYVDIFLAADDSNFASIGNGYFVRIGGTKDDICLYKKINGNNVLLIDGTDGATNKSNNTLVLKVTCDEQYAWDLNRDLTGIGQSFVKEGHIQDSSVQHSRYFGIGVTQSTSSFFQKHFFDDIAVTPLVHDLSPPTLLTALAETNHKIALHFSEVLDTSWRLIPNTLLLYDTAFSKLIVDSLVQDPLDLTVYHAFPHLPLKGSYRLVLTGLKDLAGNEATDSIVAFITWTPPPMATYRQIRISELLPDPSPPIELPEAEFVELYNASGSTFDLNAYVLSDPSTKSALPHFDLLPDHYVILCKASDSSKFKPFGDVLGLPSFPSLNNDGDRITLQNGEGTLIDKVAYTLASYQDGDKQDGGYSLELIDPTNRCATSENWKASLNVSGGTPGNRNSVAGTVLDTAAPSCISLLVVSPEELRLTFDEELDTLSLTNTNIAFSNGMLAQTITWKEDSLRFIKVTLANPLQTRTTYSLYLKQLKDCAGNAMLPETIPFALSEPAETGDIQLNEVLFNPSTGGSDFVEIYNASSKYLDLKGWMLANISADTVANQKVLLKSTFLFAPGHYLVFTANKQNILTYYPKAMPDNIMEVSSLPSYPDDAGSVVLLDPNGEQTDRFDYSSSLHSPLLSSKEGVSLEKINPLFPSNEPNNWASASKEQGYATPGYQNSQLISLGMDASSISIEPLIITPNGDGDRDFLIISIELANISTIGTIIIFDVLGREVKRLVKHSLTGTSSHIQWDGTDEAGSPVPLGHYIIWIELFNKEGRMMHYKKKAVVGEKF